MNEIKNRAQTEQQKREAIERLFQAWCKAPELRLGQFIDVSVAHHKLFHLEDEKLIEELEEFIERHQKYKEMIKDLEDFTEKFSKVQ